MIGHDLMLHAAVEYYNFLLVFDYLFSLEVLSAITSEYLTWSDLWRFVPQKEEYVDVFGWWPTE